MAIFGRKKKRKRKKHKKKEFMPPVDVQNVPTPMPPKHLSAQAMQEIEGIKGIADTSESLAPVFVKISKYRSIVNSLNYVKMGFNVIKEQMAILSKLVRLHKDNMDLLYTALEKVDNQLTKLDSDFTKPIDFMKEVSEMEMGDVKSLEKTIGDLKSQIEHLKSEVDTMA